jgi:hypothetical protein
MLGEGLKLFVYEHTAGGGYADQSIPSSALSEGYGMLRTLISDLKAAGHIVTTSLDLRIMKFNPPLLAEEIVPVSSSRKLKKILEKFSQCVDAVYIIAPESNGVLRRLVGVVEAAGGLTLNCSPDSVGIASNKVMFHESLRKLGLPAAETIAVDIREGVKLIEHAASELGFPLVFKPTDGVGCSGLSVVTGKDQIPMAIDKVRKESLSEYIVAQRLIKGTPASVSLISTSEDTLPLTLNRQRVTLASPRSNSCYHGGTVPFNHPLKDAALSAARKVVESIRGLRGYVGVDMVLTHDGPIIMEVNPRLTTSYVGLRNVVNFNPAEAIIHSVLERELPKDIRVSGYTDFSKIDVPAPTYESLQRTYKLRELISPPFPVGNEETAHGLVAATSTKLSDARTRLYRTKRHLLNILGRGQ